MTDVLYRLEGVEKRYRKAKGVETTVLRNVSLTVHRHEYLCIAGPSGGGKSTLLNLLGGLDSPTHGHIYFEGQPFRGRAQVQTRRERIGFVFQSFHLLPNRSVLENVAMGSLLAGGRGSAARKDALGWLENLGLRDRASEYPSVLSGGEQQRVAIARAMVKRPAVLLADEPTGSLDAQNRAEVLDRISTINRDYGTTVIVITHAPDEIMRYAGRQVRVDGTVLEPSEIQHAAS